MTDQTTMPGQEIATVGGGCFWCTEAVFLEVEGVTGVESGYAGGATPNPTYRQVCTGMTGHAEVVQVTFDPQAISYKEILQIFFSTHDPTTLNRQGADTGTQYRSIVLYHSPEQKATAEQVIQELNAAEIWNAPIVTQVEPFTTFYKAEVEHQEYYKDNPYQPYCRVVIAPKLSKFRKQFRNRLKQRVAD
jgi:peptide-methionine (S)-S-oxide reductase